MIAQYEVARRTGACVAKDLVQDLSTPSIHGRVQGVKQRLHELLSLPLADQVLEGFNTELEGCLKALPEFAMGLESAETAERLHAVLCAPPPAAYGAVVAVTAHAHAEVESALVMAYASGAWACSSALTQDADILGFLHDWVTANYRQHETRVAVGEKQSVGGLTQ